jgi:capsular polysaccharide biosynthesis protein
VSTANDARTGARRWWPVAVLAVVAVLGAIVGYVFAQVAGPTYVARAYVSAVARAPEDNLAAISYANAYAKMSTQSDVVNGAVQASGGSASADDLRAHVRTTASPDSPVIEVAGSASSAQHAADMANQVAAGLVSTAARSSSHTRIDFVVLSAASAPVDRAAPRPKVDAAVGAAVGLLLGGLLLLTGLGRGLTRRGPQERGGRSHSPREKADAGDRPQEKVNAGHGPPEPVESLARVPVFTDPAAHLPPSTTLPESQDPSNPPRGPGFGSDNRGG